MVVPRENRGRPSLGRSVAIPPAFAGDAVVWAAWLYYEDGLTQEDIARLIGVSRASVNNLLQTARERGIVTIAVDPVHLESVSLARAICARFGVAECLVVPRSDGSEPDYQRVGRAAARLLADRLRPDDVLGVSWGRTVLSLSDALAAKVVPGVSVVQVTGSAIGTYRFSAEFCASNIANRIGGRCVYLHAPGIVSRAAVKRILMDEPVIKEQFRIIGHCNRVIFGVGAVAASSTAFESGFLTKKEALPYIRRGAVGVLAGRFIDRLGQPVVGELDQRLIGITLEAIRIIPDRVCVAAGVEKAGCIRALLSGGFITCLVTDHAAAVAILEPDDALAHGSAG